MPGENWYLKVLRTGIEPRNEANTSRYVHEVLTNCLNWPFESIRPQPSKHGFIDYHLLAPKTNTAIRLEVKPYGKRLNDYMIRKYLEPISVGKKRPYLMGSMMKEEVYDGISEEG